MQKSTAVQKKHPFKPMRLDEATKHESSSVYVLNRFEPAGNLNITMSDGMGGTVVTRIPKTWVPMDLTTQATKSVILSTPNFRRHVMEGRLVIVSPEEAEAFIADTPGAAAELRRVYGASEFQELATEEQPLELQRLQQQTEAEDEVSGFVINLVDADIGEEEAINMIRGQEHALSEADLQHLLKFSRHAGVKEYVASLLNAQ